MSGDRIGRQEAMTDKRQKKKKRGNSARRESDEENKRKRKDVVAKLERGMDWRKEEEWME